MRQNMKFVSNFVTKFCNARISDWFYFILSPILVTTLLFSSSIKTHVNLMYKKKDVLGYYTHNVRLDTDLSFTNTKDQRFKVI